MKSLLFYGTAGGVFVLSITLLPAQIADTTHVNCPATTKQTDSTTAPDASETHWLWRNAHVTGGQLTLPFKIRKSPENRTFRLTTDVTLGGYVGYTRKIAAKKNCYLTVPLTAGLTFINLNDSNTTLGRESADAEVVPGLTWSSGLILQLEQYNIGLMFGKDYASEVGNQWAYHGKMWWSFGIGFVFLQ
jgi:hypothetical protein